MQWHFCVAWVQSLDISSINSLIFLFEDICQMCWEYILLPFNLYLSGMRRDRMFIAGDFSHSAGPGFINLFRFECSEFNCNLNNFPQTALHHFVSLVCGRVKSCDGWWTSRFYNCKDYMFFGAYFNLAGWLVTSPGW